MTNSNDKKIFNPSLDVISLLNPFFFTVIVINIIIIIEMIKPIKIPIKNFQSPFGQNAVKISNRVHQNVFGQLKFIRYTYIIRNSNLPVPKKKLKSFPILDCNLKLAHYIV